MECAGGWVLYLPSSIAVLGDALNFAAWTPGLEEPDAQFAPTSRAQVSLVRELNQQHKTTTYEKNHRPCFGRIPVNRHVVPCGASHRLPGGRFHCQSLFLKLLSAHGLGAGLRQLF